MKQKKAAGSATKGQSAEVTPSASSPNGQAFCQEERAAEVSGVAATWRPPYSRDTIVVNEFGGLRFAPGTFGRQAALYSAAHTSYGLPEPSDRTQDHGTRSRTLADTYRGY